MPAPDQINKPMLTVVDNAAPPSTTPPNSGGLGFLRLLTQEPKPRGPAAHPGWSEARKAKWLRRHPLVQNSLVTTMVPVRTDPVATTNPRPERSGRGRSVEPRQIRIVEARRQYIP